ncbi:MAG: signal peptide peptidase SppA [Saprospiraceae bacterium]
MSQFFKFLFASCLGTFLALILLFFFLLTLGAGKVASELKNTDKQVMDNTVLKVSIPDQLPEQTDNIAMNDFRLGDNQILGVHDYAAAIVKAASDPKVKGMYIQGQMNAHGYATLKIIRDAILKFREQGKFVVAFSNYYDHKNYYIASAANQVAMHPLGFLQLNGFGASIPFYKELMEKIGLSFNIYYAGEFKSATEPFRLAKMSDQNRLQLREYLNSQLDLYVQQVAETRKIDAGILRTDFDQFQSYTADKAIEHKLMDQLCHEEELFSEIKSKLSLDKDKSIDFMSVEDYFKATGKDEDYAAKNKIAVLFAEGQITDAKGNEGEIGKKYLKIIRDIRTNDKIKALVLRVNSPGGSAIMSDEILNELDMTRAAGKPVVVSMGDYAASGGYFIACHADSIFASPHTLTGSIGVFAMIPNFKTMTDEKIGVDFDTVGTGPMSNRFSLAFKWNETEGKIMQENIDRTYLAFLKVVADGRKMDIEKTKEIAKGRIWAGPKAVELGLVNRLGELSDAIHSAASLASIDKYRIAEYPQQPDPIQKIINKIQGKDEDISSSMQNKILREQLGEMYPVYQEWQQIRQLKGAQMRLPIKITY